MQIKFESGNFEKYVATRSFSLGGTDYRFSVGDEVLFDGGIAKMYNNSVALPQLKGAIRIGWFVPKDDYEEDNPEYARPVSANIRVQNPIKSGNSTEPKKAMPYVIEGDERIVSTVSNRTADVKRRNTEQEEVRRFKSPKHPPVEINSSNATMMIREASKVSIQAGKGITEDEYLKRLSEEEREEYLAKKQIAKSRYVTESDVKPSRVTESEGIKLTTTMGGGVSTADLSGSDAKADITVTEVGGIKFTNTNIREGRKAFSDCSVPNDVNTRRSIARSICPDFPDTYDFSQPAKKRIARLVADFDNRQDILRAAYAAETDEVKGHLVTEFPEAFQQ